MRVIRIAIAVLCIAALNAPAPVIAESEDWTGAAPDPSGGYEVSVGENGDSASVPDRPAGPSPVCSYFTVEGVVATPVEIAYADLAEGGVYVLRCTLAGEVVTNRIFVHDPAEPAISALGLALTARATLHPAHPRPSTSPGIQHRQLVGIPTWLWIDNWNASTATASIPGLAATVTATPTHIDWNMGDGTTVTCAGPGTPYDLARPEAAQATDCAHTYQHDGDHPVNATIHYRITWTATNGENGALAPASRTTAFTLDTASHQAIGRN